MSGQSAKTHEDIEAEIILIQQQAQSKIRLIQQQAEAQIALIQQQARCRDRVLALPDIFRIIIQMVGLESLNDLHRCRQVCSSWNQQILSLVWRSETSRRILMARIRSNWGPGLLPTDEEISRAKSLERKGILDSVLINNLTERVRERIGVYGTTEAELKCGASLALHGLLGPLDELVLAHVDLSRFPAEQLTSLVSSVTISLQIIRVSGSDLLSLLRSLKCKFCLSICHQSLDGEETQALVQAMESRVKNVHLHYAQLDMEALTSYSGHGKCRGLKLWGIDRAVKRRVSTWARSKNWRVDNRGVGMLGVTKE